MNPEEIKKRFAEEGLSHIYQWTDKPGKVYPEHAHVGKVSFYVVKGLINMDIGGVKTIAREGNRMNVPPKVPHSGLVGAEGCTMIVGEEIEGDS